MIRYLNSGESHGKCLTAIIEGMPANLIIDINRINCELHLRQSGYGRGSRMKIENDKVEILSGIRDGKTIGSPICIKIDNVDWENHQDIMDIEKITSNKKITVPRPGHADLNGFIKYDANDITNILERSSARETAIRVAVGSVAEQLLNEFGVRIYSHVIKIGSINSNAVFEEEKDIVEIIDKSSLRCIDSTAENMMIKIIDSAKLNGDSLGGIFEVVAEGVPIGLGSCMHYDRKLDARISSGLMSIQGIKGIEFGMGFRYANELGSKCHDEILYDNAKGYYRNTNNAGGIEGGMSNGENIIVRAVMKPIPTLNNPLMSIDTSTKQKTYSAIHRSDICAVPSASIIGKSIVSYEIASAFVEKFGGDSIREMKRNYDSYMKYLKKK